MNGPRAGRPDRVDGGMPHRKNLATQLVLLPTLPLVFIQQVAPGSNDIWWLAAVGLLAYLVR